MPTKTSSGGPSYTINSDRSGNCKLMSLLSRHWGQKKKFARFSRLLFIHFMFQLVKGTAQNESLTILWLRFGIKFIQKIFFFGIFHREKLDPCDTLFFWLDWRWWIWQIVFLTSWHQWEVVSFFLVADCYCIDWLS